MSSRAHILGRIRTALKRASPRPWPPEPGRVFPEIPQAELLPRFEKEFAALKGIFHQASNWQEAHTWLRKMAEEHGFKHVVAAPDPDAMEAGGAIGARILTGDGDCSGKLANTDLGITVCECLLAFTGSVIITPQTGFGRALSVLPPAHLVVARRSQLLPNLGDGYRFLQNRYSRMWPSMMTIITGPSRTADIEKILVMGAHGPKKLFVLLLDF